jgi:hypothetical protein
MMKSSLIILQFEEKVLGYPLKICQIGNLINFKGIKYLSTKGSLISEGILSLVPFPKKGAESRPFYSKQLIQIFCSG